MSRALPRLDLAQQLFEPSALPSEQPSGDLYALGGLQQFGNPVGIGGGR